MKFLTFFTILILGFIFFASGAELVTKNQENQLIKVLKKWTAVYNNGIKAKQFIEKRGVQGQQQSQQQTMNNQNQINIHLHQLQNSYSNYHGYQSQHQSQYGGNSYYNRYPSPHGARYGSSRSSSRKR